MSGIFSLKTVWTTLIGAGIAGTIAALPVRANENHPNNKSISADLIISQNYGNYRERDTYSKPANDFNRIVGMTGLAIGTGLVGWRVAKAYKPSLLNSMSAIDSNASLLDRISPKLRRQLLRLVHNRQTANRLLSGTLMSHPDRSPNWLAEKVIYDLQRDRI